MERPKQNLMPPQSSIKRIKFNHRSAAPLLLQGKRPFWQTLLLLLLQRQRRGSDWSLPLAMTKRRCACVCVFNFSVIPHALSMYQFVACTRLQLKINQLSAADICKTLCRCCRRRRCCCRWHCYRSRRRCFCHLDDCTI